MTLTLEAQNPDCSSLRDEAETLREELGSLILEVRTFANRIKATHDPDTSEWHIAESLLAVTRGE